MGFLTGLVPPARRFSAVSTKRLFLTATKVWMRDGQYGKHRRGRLVKKAPHGDLGMKRSGVDSSIGSNVCCCAAGAMDAVNARVDLDIRQTSRQRSGKHLLAWAGTEDRCRWPPSQPAWGAHDKGGAGANLLALSMTLWAFFCQVAARTGCPLALHRSLRNLRWVHYTSEQPDA